MRCIQLQKYLKFIKRTNKILKNFHINDICQVNTINKVCVRNYF